MWGVGEIKKPKVPETTMLRIEVKRRKKTHCVSQSNLEKWAELQSDMAVMLY